MQSYIQYIYVQFYEEDKCPYDNAINLYINLNPRTETSETFCPLSFFINAVFFRRWFMSLQISIRHMRAPNIYIH